MTIRNSDLDARLARHEQTVTQAVKNVYAEQSAEFRDELTRGVAREALQIKSHVDDRYAALLDRIEELESRGATPGRTSSAANAASREHLKRFDAWLRRPHDADVKNALSEFESRERKQVNIGTPSDGGYAVPEELSREIERLELKLSPVRRLVKVVKTSSPNYRALVNIRGANSGWAGEQDARTQTNTPQLRERVPTHGEIFSYPEVSEWSLDDIFFNVADWLAEEAAQSFAIAEGDAVIRGDGTNKPTGMLRVSPATTPDFASPMRAAGAFQYLPSMVGSPGVAGIDADVLVDTVYTLNSAYRANATWVMNSQTAAHVMKLKDSLGRFLWSESLIGGQPARLLGYPVEIWEQTDDIGHQKYPIMFGDFSRGYLLADRVGLRITVDAVTRPGFQKFYVRRREAGCVLNGDAVKLIRTVNA